MVLHGFHSGLKLSETHPFVLSSSTTLTDFLTYHPMQEPLLQATNLKSKLISAKQITIYPVYPRGLHATPLFFNSTTFGHQPADTYRLRPHADTVPLLPNTGMLSTSQSRSVLLFCTYKVIFKGSASSPHSIVLATEREAKVSFENYHHFLSRLSLELARSSAQQPKQRYDFSKLLRFFYQALI